MSFRRWRRRKPALEQFRAGLDAHASRRLRIGPVGRRTAKSFDPAARPKPRLYASTEIGIECRRDKLSDGALVERMITCDELRKGVSDLTRTGGAGSATKIEEIARSRSFGRSEQMDPTDISDFRSERYRFLGKEKAVLRVGDRGPAVIAIHEIYGFTPTLARLLPLDQRGPGFQVYAPRTLRSPRCDEP